MSIPIFSLKTEDKKYLRTYFFETPDAKKSTCKACKTSHQYDMGLTNSMKHIEAAHKCWPDALKSRENSSDSVNTMETYLQMIDPKAQNYHDWAEWVIMANHPFSFVNDKYSRKYSKPRKG